jgi:hypothetical protein
MTSHDVRTLSEGRVGNEMTVQPRGEDREPSPVPQLGDLDNGEPASAVEVEGPPTGGDPQLVDARLDRPQRQPGHQRRADAVATTVGSHDRADHPRTTVSQFRVLHRDETDTADDLTDRVDRDEGDRQPAATRFAAGGVDPPPQVLAAGMAAPLTPPDTGQSDQQIRAVDQPLDPDHCPLPTLHDRTVGVHPCHGQPFGGDVKRSPVPPSPPAAAPSYPIPRPQQDDSRFTIGLVARLDRAAHQISGGTLDARVPPGLGPPELRRLARSFNTMADDVTDCLERQRAFVSQASHQLRNPLTALRLRVEELGGFITDPAGREEHRLALEEADRLRSILDGLLTLARAERGGYGQETVDAADTADARVAGWQPLALLRGIALRRSGARALRSAPYRPRSARPSTRSSTTPSSSPAVARP